MSYTPESELNSRWRLRITAGYESDHLIVEYDLVVDSYNVLAVQIARLGQDPAISSIQCERFDGRQPSSSQHVPALAGRS